MTWAFYLAVTKPGLVLYKLVLALAPALALTCAVAAAGSGHEHGEQNSSLVRLSSLRPGLRVARFAVNGTILKDPDYFQ